MGHRYSDTYNFEFEFSQLGITGHQIEKMAGFEGPAPEPFPQYIHEVLENAKSMKGIRGSLYIFKGLDVAAQKGCIFFDGICFNTGKIIATHLNKCMGVGIFVCTAGNILEHYSRKQNDAGNLPEAYIADVAGSLIVETAMDKIQERFQDIARELGYGITNRYSPGYCGWNVAEQQLLFGLLPPNPAGVSLTPSSLMKPIKSVSGIIGFGPGVKSKGYTCQFCEITECIYRSRRMDILD